MSLRSCSHPLGTEQGFPLGGLMMLCCSPPPFSQSIFRVVFHDRRLQYTEHQQLEGWRWNRPGDRILDIGGVPRGDGGGIGASLGSEGQFCHGCAGLCSLGISCFS